MTLSPSLSCHYQNIESLQTELVELDRAEKKMLEETSEEKKQLLPNHANAKVMELLEAL